MNQTSPGLYKAYSRANHTVSKTRQVVMLYDGAIRFLQQAIEAIEKKDYETRYHKLTRTCDIVIGLQSCLDFDAGGDSAKVLFDFYSAIDSRIFAVHRTNDIEECRKIIAQIKEMRDVWSQIDRGPDAATAASTGTGEAPAAKPTPDPSDSLTVSA
ncbi:MAG: flagellar export chaperone FliS [Pseudomonadota bacterium]